MHADDRPLNVLAALRPHTVYVVCFGVRWELYPDSAYDWIGLAAADFDGLAGIFPGAVVDDQCEQLFRASMQDEARDRKWANAARVALGRAGGRDWWWTNNLIRKCVEGWPYVNGVLLRQGVSAREMPLPDWLDAVYTLMWQNQDDNGRVKLDLELQRTPTGVVVAQSKAQTRAAMEAFAAD